MVHQPVEQEARLGPRYRDLVRGLEADAVVEVVVATEHHRRSNFIEEVRVGVIRAVGSRIPSTWPSEGGLGPGIDDDWVIAGGHRPPRGLEQRGDGLGLHPPEHRGRMR